MKSLKACAILSSLLLGTFAIPAESRVTRETVSLGGVVTGTARIRANDEASNPSRRRARSRVTITITDFSAVADEIDRGAPLEAWLVDAGAAGGVGTSEASSEDSALAGALTFDGRVTSQAFTFADQTQVNLPAGNILFDDLIQAAPFAQSLGILTPSRRGTRYTLTTRLKDDLESFDSIMITLETTGKLGKDDPRPGSEVARGLRSNI